jgi:AcrR family transcriptional regulator
LEAASALVRVGGYAALTITSVASRSGINKPTVYRRWRHRRELAVDLLVARFSPLPITEDGSLLERLTAIANALVVQVSDPVVARLLPALAIDVQEDPTASDRLRREVTLPRREATKHAIEQAITRGEIPELAASGVDVEVAVDLLAAPVFFRLLHGEGAIDAALADQSALAVARLLGAPV